MRALALRCPRCGGGGSFRSWFHMHESCPTCGLTLERGEDHDYWYGGYMFNLIAAELATVVITFGIVVVRYPHVPWTFVGYAAPALAVGTPILTFPFTRGLWLAWDLAFRPTEPGDRSA
jgi:uncharacterized protein (DUF983 family)